MPVARFEMPDGKIARFEVPEGTTPEQAQSMISSYVDSQEFQSVAAQPQKKGFFERVGQDVKGRLAKREEILKARRRGEQGYVESGFQQAGQVGAGLMLDVSGEIASEVLGAADYLTGGTLSSMGKGVLSAASNLPVIGGGTVGEMVSNDVGALSKFAKENPRLTRNVESALNIGLMTVPTVKYGEKVLETGENVAKSTYKALKSPVEFADKIGKGLAARTPDQLDEAASFIKKESSRLYQESRKAGVVLNRPKAQSLINKMNKAISDSGKLNDRLHGDTLSVMEDLQKSVRSGDVSFENFEQYRQLLRDVVEKNTDAIKGMNPDALKASEAISALDDVVDKLKPIDIVGGDDTAIKNLLQARKEWKRYRKFEQIAHMVKKADGDPNKIRSAFKRFVDKPKNLRGFSKMEKAMIKSIANPSSADQILKGLGRFGFEPQNVFLPMVGGYIVGGPQGAALMTIGTAARQARKYATRMEPEQLLKFIEKAP